MIEGSFWEDVFVTEFEFPGVEPPPHADLDSFLNEVEEIVRKYSHHIWEDQGKFIRAHLMRVVSIHVSFFVGGQGLTLGLRSFTHAGEQLQQIEENLNEARRQIELLQIDEWERTKFAIVFMLKALLGVTFAIIYIQVAYRTG